MCVRVCVLHLVCVGAGVRVCASGRQRLIVSVLLSSCPSYSLRQALLLNLEHLDEAGSLVRPKNPFSLPSQSSIPSTTELVLFYVAAEP